MSDAPETIWADEPDLFDGLGFWSFNEGNRATEYTRADLCIRLNDPALVALVKAVQDAIIWDGHDDEGVAAVWLDKAHAALAAYTARMEGGVWWDCAMVE